LRLWIPVLENFLFRKKRGKNTVFEDLRVEETQESSAVLVLILKDFYGWKPGFLRTFGAGESAYHLLRTGG
jgi:hypothetical protein